MQGVPSLDCCTSWKSDLRFPSPPSHVIVASSSLSSHCISLSLSLHVPLQLNYHSIAMTTAVNNLNQDESSTKDTPLSPTINLLFFFSFLLVNFLPAHLNPTLYLPTIMLVSPALIVAMDNFPCDLSREVQKEKRRNISHQVSNQLSGPVQRIR